MLVTAVPALIRRFGVMEMEAESRSQIQSGGTTRKTFDRGAIVSGGDRASTVGVPITVLTKHQIMSSTPNGNRLGAAVMADLRAKVLAGEEVGRMDVVVAQQTELGGVSSAVEKGNSVIAEVAGHRFVWRSNHSFGLVK